MDRGKSPVVDQNGYQTCQTLYRQLQPVGFCPTNRSETTPVQIH